ncbi:hypothetical protein ABK040_008801 [Willaertia magna]
MFKWFTDKYYLLTTGKNKAGTVFLPDLKSNPTFTFGIGLAYLGLIYIVLHLTEKRHIKTHYEERLTQRKRREGLFLLTCLREDKIMNDPLFKPNDDLVDIERWPTSFEQNYTKQAREEIFKEYIKLKR